MSAADSLPVIQATLAPAFLMTGGGIFLNFVQARLFRVNDHLRRLRAEADDGGALVAIALQRGRILRNAIAFGVLGLAFVVLTMLALLAAVFFPALPRGTVVLPFAAGLVSFTAALGLGLEDTFLSFRSLRTELQESPRPRTDLPQGP